MYPFSSVPVLRLLIPFCLGIVIQIFFPASLNILVSISVLAVITVAAFTFYKPFFRSYKYRWIFGVAMTFFMGSIAMILVTAYTENLRPAYFGNQIKQADGFVFKITEPCHEKEKSLKSTAQVLAIREGNSWKAVTGIIIVYLEKSSLASELKYGDIIYTRQKPEEVREPQNPGAFNYKRFLSFHGIYHQCYLKTGHWIKTDQNSTNILWKVAYTLKARLVKEIKQQIISINEVGVCSALLIGYEDYLDQELIDAYSSSGALHVLSVSGLHVGIIFIVLQWLLGWMEKKPTGRSIKNILIILFIWFYALLAGLAPSILRSAVMITLIITGKWLKRDSYMLNTTLWSSFLLLHFNPYMITEVGFQLSYLAVFGIVYLHQRLVQQWTAPNNFLQKIWELTSVSLCAQLMTFPLGLLYFNQFPNLFLISNLLVIPISSSLMIVSLMATASIGFPWLAFYLWKVSFILAWLMNRIVLTVDKIPYALLKGIWISIGQTWVIYLMIAMALWFIIYKSKTGFYLWFCTLFIFLCWMIADEYTIRQQQKLIVYNLHKVTAVDVISGRNHVFIIQDKGLKDKSQIRFNIERKWYELGIKSTYHTNFNQKFTLDTSREFGLEEKELISQVKEKNEFIQIGNKIIFIPTQWLPAKTEKEKIKVDIVIVTSRFRNKLSKLEEIIDADKIILDGSANWKRLLKEKPLHPEKYYNVNLQGAFLCDLQ